jgi:hypothetical protein
VVTLPSALKQRKRRETVGRQANAHGSMEPRSGEYQIA